MITITPIGFDAQGKATAYRSGPVTALVAGRQVTISQGYTAESAARCMVLCWINAEAQRMIAALAAGMRQ